MDPQRNESQTVNNPTSSPSIQTGCLTERRIPLTPYRFGFHRPADLSFLSCFTSPPLPHLPTYTDSFSKGCVVLDSLLPENEELYANGWYGGNCFTEESNAAEAESSQDDSAEFQVFVGNLADEVIDYVLEETFKVKYASVKGARVVSDRTTGRSKGYGFVRFGDEEEQTRSVTELNGQYCLTRPMRIGSIGRTSAQKATFQSFLGTQSESAPNKTTVGNFGRLGQYSIFVNGLDSDVTEESLREVCGQFGELSGVEIHEGKRCGTVQFNNRDSAHKALVALNETGFGGSNVRVTWGPSTQDPFAGMLQQHLDSNQRPDAAMKPMDMSNEYEYNGSYEAYGYVVTNKISFQGGRPVCYQHFQKQ